MSKYRIDQVDNIDRYYLRLQERAEKDGSTSKRESGAGPIPIILLLGFYFALGFALGALIYR